MTTPFYAQLLARGPERAQAVLRIGHGVRDELIAAYAVVKEYGSISRLGKLAPQYISSRRTNAKFDKLITHLGGLSTEAWGLCDMQLAAAAAAAVAAVPSTSSFNSHVDLSRAFLGPHRPG
jgi:hypothetical protein